MEAGDSLKRTPPSDRNAERRDVRLIAERRRQLPVTMRRAEVLKTVGACTRAHACVCLSVCVSFLSD